MASAAVPLRVEHPEINVTTPKRHGSNYSETFASFSRPATPHLTLHEFRKLQQSPFLSASPDSEPKRLRRKPSVSNLSGKFSQERTSAEIYKRTAQLLHSNRTPTPLPLLLQPLPSTPLQRSSTASPSLSSTITTIQSTPTKTPALGGSTHLQPWRSEGNVHWNESIRTKRKFNNFKQPKRLPKLAPAGDWQVYAAIIDLDVNGQGIAEEAIAQEEDCEEKVDLERAAQAATEYLPEGKKGRAVRFAGVGSEARRASRQSHPTRGQVFSEEKDTTLTSSFSLSKFKFPTPPGDTWAGTFGHLTEPTPPTSPATLHYRGASFDVVNPHASLLFGVHDFETPAEIDGLLDDYFLSRTDSAQTSSINIMADMPSAQHSSQSVSEYNRRGRTLYTDADSARRNIMRIPTTSVHTTADAYQESPLANRGTPSSFSQSLRNVEEAWRQADIADKHREWNTNGAGRAERGSSIYPHSNFSEPFDLCVSDNEDMKDFNNIDEVIGGVREHFNNEDLQGRDDDFVVYEEGADAQPDASLQNQDMGYTNILDDYDYTRVPLAHFDEDMVAYAMPSPPSFLERARGIVPSNASSHAATASSQIDADAADNKGKQSGYWSCFMSPPNLPPPPPPMYSPDTGMAPREYHYYPDCTELPSSEQTYGNTGQLLQITPKHHAYSPYPGPAYEGINDYGIRPSFIETSEVGDEDEYKENLPPDSAGLDISVANKDQQGIPQTWSGCDLPRRSRPSTFDRSLYGQPMARSPSHYPVEDESVWESTQASASHPTLQDAATRPSEDSYADTSVYSGENRMSFIGPQGQPHRMNCPGHGGSSTVAHYANKAHRVLFDGPNDATQDAVTKRAQQIIENQILENAIFDKMLIGVNHGATPKASKEQRRTDLVELEKLRRENPSVIHTAAERVFNKIQKPFPMRPYNPHDSFNKIAKGAESLPSEGRGLLRSNESQCSNRGGLQYSNTHGTFITIPRAAPPAPGMTISATDKWSPLASPPTAMTRRTPTGTISSQHTGNGDEFEMTTLNRGAWSRPAMSSQTGLRSLHLGRGHASSTTTCPPPPDRPMTDEELMAREPNWTLDPRATRRTTTIGSRFGFDCERPGVSESVPMLRSLEEGRNPAQVKEQKKISRKYFNACSWIPILSLAYGLGYFDGSMKRATHGRITEMRRKDKQWALTVSFPLGCLGYAALGLVIAIVVFAVTSG